MKKLFVVIISFFLFVGMANAAKKINLDSSHTASSICSSGDKTLIDGKYYCVTNANKEEYSTTCSGTVMNRYGTGTTNYQRCCHYDVVGGECVIPGQIYSIQGSCNANDTVMSVTEMPDSPNGIDIIMIPLFTCCNNLYDGNNCYLKGQEDVQSISCSSGFSIVDLNNDSATMSITCCQDGSTYYNGNCITKSNPICIKGTLTTNQELCSFDYTSEPDISVKAYKATSGTEVDNNSYSDEGLRFTFDVTVDSSTTGKMYYCISTSNNCTPSTALNGLELTSTTSYSGIYYLRYKVVTSENISSEIKTFTANVDTITPSVSLVVKKSISETAVSSGSWSNEPLVFTLTKGTVGTSDGVIKYCKDTNNTCTPNTTIASGTEIASFTSTIGTYYFRYKIISGAGKESNVGSFTARVDTANPIVNITAKKATSGTVVASGAYSNEGLKFILTKSSTTISGGETIYYCKDTNNSCTPTTTVTSGSEITDYTTTTGTYYIRYKITNAAGTSSAVGSYKAIIDKTIPTVTITAKKKTSNTSVNSGTYSDEGLNFTLTQGTVGSSGATIYYCKDTSNSCTPTTEIASGNSISSYNTLTGTYYIRFKIVSGSGISSNVDSYKSMIDTSTPTVSIEAKKATSGTSVADSTYSSEELKFIFTSASVGASGATIYYCQDTTNNCNPTTSIGNKVELTNYTNVTGTYYIRYKIVSGSGKESTISSFKAIVDTTIPTVDIVAKKVTSNTIVENGEFSDEGLKYTLTEGNVGASGAKIYYCQDTSNTCNPTTIITSGTELSNYTTVTGIYYIRYKVTNGDNKSSSISSFKATIDSNMPTITIYANKKTSGKRVATSTTSDEGLLFKLVEGNVGASGATIYYCVDENNTCNPETVTENNTIIDLYSTKVGTYYLRYKIVSGTNRTSDTFAFKAIVEIDTTPKEIPIIIGKNKTINVVNSTEQSYFMNSDGSNPKVYVDNELVDSVNYEVKKLSSEDSLKFNDCTEKTCVTVIVKKAYINSLTEGDHTIEFVFDNGVSTGNINIVNSSSYQPKKYEVVLGDKQVVNFKKNGKLEFKIDANIDDFSEIYITKKSSKGNTINKQVVSSNYYTLKSGSTIITFNDDFNKLLENGEYELTVAYKDGEANTSFVVNNANQNNPRTGTFVSGTLVLIGVIGIVLLRSKKRFYRI